MQDIAGKFNIAILFRYLTGPTTPLNEIASITTNRSINVCLFQGIIFSERVFTCKMKVVNYLDIFRIRHLLQTGWNRGVREG